MPWGHLLLLAALLLPAAAAPTPLLRVMGRTFPGPDASGALQLPQLLTWPATSITVAFSGPDVTVVLDAQLEGLPPAHRLLADVTPGAGFPTCYFQFDLDGQASVVGKLGGGTPVLTWTRQGLGPGQHTLTITKLTEARVGAAWLRSVELGAGGAFSPPPPSPGALSGRRLLVMGDSYSSGSGNAGGRDCPTLMFAAQNALLTYGAKAAAHYGADLQLLAWGGAGLNLPQRSAPSGRALTPQEVAVVSPIMRELFTRSDAISPGPTYDPRLFVPQAVVMAAGTNDFRDAVVGPGNHLGGPSADELRLGGWLDKVEAHVRQIRTTYPQAAIVMLAFPFEQLMAGVKAPKQTAAYLQYMSAAHTRLQMVGFKGVHFLQVSGESFDSSNWCAAHPDAPTHQKIANQLIEFLDAVVPGFGAAAAAA